MKKKGLLIFLLAAISSLSVSAAVGCGNNNNGKQAAATHKHDTASQEWTVADADQPTTTTQGSAVRTCSGNDQTQTVTLPVLGEAYEKTTNQDGSITYSITLTDTDYGSVTVSFTHTHSGEWVVSDENKPTDTATGKAVRVCASGDETKEITLPVLTDSSYTIINDTADVGEAGTATYKIIKDGATVTFTAATPALVASDELVDVSYKLNLSDDVWSAQTYSGKKSKIFTISAEVRDRAESTLYTTNNKDDSTHISCSYTKSIKLGGSSDKIVINAKAAGTLILHLKNGSSNFEGDYQQIVLTKTGEKAQTINYVKTGVRTLTLTLEEGEYTISRTQGTTDIYYMEFDTQLYDAPVNGIIVNDGGTVDYYEGQTFNSSSLSVGAVHAQTGVVDELELSNVEIDSSAFNSAVAGVYPITVSYSVPNTNKVFTTTYNVTVYGIDSISLGINQIEQATNKYNTIYVNNALRQLYFINDTFSANGLTVKAQCSVTVNGNTLTKEFILDETEYTLANNSTTGGGKKDISVTFTSNGVTKTNNFTIYVIEKASDLATAESVDIYVSSSVTAAQVGSYDSQNGYQFQTIQQAVDFIDYAGISDDAVKTINLAAGTYNEKIEINAKNVHIVGAGSDTTKIEYNSLYGVADESGSANVTDSTATLAVRVGAEGFTISGVTISNYWNSQTVFDTDLGANYSEHRALALLVQADRVIIDDCKLLGYQDTVEFFTGRQIVKNTYISGTTDFIFGTNNTTYFYNCEIRSIATTENTKTSGAKGGYITAFKGLNKGTSTDGITYGAIFDHCDFTCDDGVQDGITAIGRTWGSNAAVMVMNSTLRAHISKDSGTDRNSRYVAMNGAPADAQFVEYNNTGDGAITASQTGVTVLTDAAAANAYKTFATIFGTTNGNVTYSSAWDGTVGSAVKELVDWSTYAYKIGDSIILTDGEGTIQNTTGTFEGVSIDATASGSKYAVRASNGDVQINAGTVLTFKVASGVTAENISIRYYDSAQYIGKITISVEDGVATLTATAQTYVYSISIVQVESSLVQNVTVTISYDGVVEGANTIEVENGGTITQTAVNEKVTVPSGKKIAGYYTNSTFESAFDFNSAISEALTIYVKFEDDVSTTPDPTAHTHTYAKGNVTTAPTDSETGSATAECTDADCTDTENKGLKPVTLPVLTDSGYTITNNTATAEAAGEGTYTIIVDGVEVSFTAATAAMGWYAYLASQDGAYSNDFSSYTDGYKLTKLTSFGTRGIYSDKNDSDYYVEVKNGAATQVVKATSDKKNNFNTIIDFGTVGDVLEGYLELSADAVGSDWKIVSFYNGSTVCAISTDSNKKFSFVINDVAQTVKNTISFTVNATYSVYYKFDFATGKVTIKINGTAFVTDMAIDITSLSGIYIPTSNSAGRLVTLDNVAFVSTTYELATVQDALVTRLQNAYDSYDLTQYTKNGTYIGTAYNTGLTGIRGATTSAAAKEAYNTAIADMAAVDTDLVDVQKSSIKELEENYLETSYIADNWEIVKPIIDEYKTAINAATTTTGVTNLLDEAKTEIEKTPKGTGAITVTISNGTDTVGSRDAVSGQTLTYAQLVSKITVAQGKQIKALYESYDDGAFSSPITEGFTVTTEVTIYVEFEDRVYGEAVTYSLDDVDLSTNKTISNGTNLVELNDKNSNSTGLYVIKGSGSDIKTGTKNSTPCLQLGGTVAKDKNAIVAYCGAGHVTITVVYFHGDKTGRYIKVLDKDGTKIVDSSDKPIVTTKTLTTATLEFDLDDDQKIYIGSADSGIYIYSLKIETHALATTSADAASDDATADSDNVTLESLAADDKSSYLA